MKRQPAETLDEFCERVGANAPLSPRADARVRAVFEAPLPPLAVNQEQAS